MAGAKSKRRSIDGILIFDKPLGMSSNAALQKVRWLLPLFADLGRQSAVSNCCLPLMPGKTECPFPPPPDPARALHQLSSARTEGVRITLFLHECNCFGVSIHI